MKKSLLKFAFALVCLLTMAGKSFAQVPGTLDSTFADNGILIFELDNGFENINNMIVLEDDKILCLGFSENDNDKWDNVIFRLHPDGTLDSTFGENGFTIFNVSGDLDFPYAMTLQDDGKIVVAGGGLVTVSDVQIYAARLNPDGGLDNTFGNGGITLVDVTDGGEDLAYGAAIQPDGKIVLVGENQLDGFVYTDPVVVRLNNDGTLDESFGADGNGVVTISLSEDYCELRAVMILEDESILAVGAAANNNSNLLALKLQPNGLIDSSFVENGVGIYNLNNGADEAYAITRHPLNNRILIGGRMGNGSSKTELLVMSLQENGEIDSTFGIDGLCTLNVKAQEAILDLAVQENGKILAAGTSGGSGLGVNDWLVARFNEEGTVDSTFGESFGYTLTEAGSFFSTATAIDIMSDGKIISAGISANTNNDWCLIRYHGDDIATGIGNTSIGTSSQSLVPYPNPSAGDFTVKLNTTASTASNAQVTILNQVGQVVYNREVNVIGGILAEKFNGNLFPTSGIYMMRIVAGQEEFNGTIMIQK